MKQYVLQGNTYHTMLNTRQISSETSYDMDQVQGGVGTTREKCEEDHRS